MLKNDYILKKQENYKKEHYEILAILKEVVYDPSFVVTPNCFNKEFLNLQMINNDKIKKIIESIKEKLKGPNFLNQNIFHLLKYSNKKTSKEKFVLVNSLNTFNIFFNEPKYILDSNLKLYNSLIPLINSLGDKYRFFSIINGKSNDNSESTKNLKENESNQILTPEKILEEIYSIKNENTKVFTDKDKFKFFPKLINFEDLKNKYKNLISNYINYDDESVVKKKVDLLNKIIIEKSKEEIYPYIKHGIPHSLRKDIYKLFLNVQEEDVNSVKSLNETSDYLIAFDYLISNDMNITCNNENYFLFEEGLTNLMSKFLRDPDLVIEVQGIRPLIVISLPGTNNYVQFPQCGVIPYKGITYLAAPFSYLAMNLTESYIIFRKFFAYHLSQLSSINSNENSISSLIYNFDFLFNRIFPNLCIFLKNYNIDINKIVINWFMTCFAQIINVNQVFILYDIILTNKNMHFLIFIALGLCYLIEKEVMALTSKNEIIEAFNNFYEIEILEVVKNLCDNF